MINPNIPIFVCPLPPAFPASSFSLSLSPWPKWSVIERAVFTWPTGMEGTLCALWRQIALLAPSSQYLTFTPHPLLILCSSSLFISQPCPSAPFFYPYCWIQLFNFHSRPCSGFEAQTFWMLCILLVACGKFYTYGTGNICTVETAAFLRNNATEEQIHCYINKSET